MESTDNSSIPKPSVSNFILAPFTYQKMLRDHFKKRDKTWQWFGDKKIKEQQVAEFKEMLLKNTYRLDKETHKNLYDMCSKICEVLAIDADVTLYQEHNSTQLNAGISIFEKEAHIVFSGSLINLLSEDEMLSLLAHELSHYLFYKMDNEEFEVTQRIVLALANDERSEDAIIETARIFQLYMELFCDAGSLLVCKDYKTVIQTLVKLNTGLTEVNAESYLSQAKEILERDSKATSNDSHPESYIRSLALSLRAEGSEEYISKVKQMIEGELNMSTLDIFKQVEMQELTYDVLQLIVKPDWMNTSAVQNLCGQYFNDFYRKTESKDLEELGAKIEKTDVSVQNYLSYVLLDFTKVDAELELVPMGHTFEIAEMLHINDDYEKTVRKELKLTVRDLKLLQEKAMAELQQVKEGKDSSIYTD